MAHDSNDEKRREYATPDMTRLKSSAPTSLLRIMRHAVPYKTPYVMTSFRCPCVSPNDETYVPTVADAK
eukprot:31020-Pelagococcus_subviridis.AAC.2